MSFLFLLIYTTCAYVFCNRSDANKRGEYKEVRNLVKDDKMLYTNGKQFLTFVDCLIN